MDYEQRLDEVMTRRWNALLKDPGSDGWWAEFDALDNADRLDPPPRLRRKLAVSGDHFPGWIVGKGAVFSERTASPDNPLVQWHALYLRLLDFPPPIPQRPPGTRSKDWGPLWAWRRRFAQLTNRDVACLTGIAETRLSEMIGRNVEWSGWKKG